MFVMMTLEEVSKVRKAGKERGEERRGKVLERRKRGRTTTMTATKQKKRKEEEEKKEINEERRRQRKRKTKSIKVNTCDFSVL